MCGCSAPLNQFPRSGRLGDIEILEFQGLGRAKGFKVQSRRSALDNEVLRTAILERARAILSLVDPQWSLSRQEKDIEFLKTDLSETERRLRKRETELEANGRMLTAMKEELTKTKARVSVLVKAVAARDDQLQVSKRELAAKDTQLQEYATSLQQRMGHSSALKGTLRKREGELETLRSAWESTREDLEGARGRLRNMSSRVTKFLEVSEPVFEKAEYVAMDDESFAEEYQQARNSKENIRSLVERSLGDNEPADSEDD